MKKLALFAILLLISTAVFAAEPKAPPFWTFKMSAEQKKSIGNLMLDQWQSTVGHCAAPQLKQSFYLVDTEPKFTKAGAPISGAWRVVGQMEGCGESHIFNIAQTADPDGKISSAALLPGLTVTDEKLQKEALPYVSKSMAGIAPKDCKDSKIIDTKLLGSDGGYFPTLKDIKKHPWAEKWTVKTCTITGTVVLHFTPGLLNTAIASKQEDTQKIAP